MLPCGRHATRGVGKRNGAGLGTFEFVEHTADLGVVGRGESQAEALTWLAKGMFSAIADLELVEPRGSIDVSVDSTDAETLSVDWLNELLFRYEGEGFLPKDFEVTVDRSGSALTARCIGEPADPERHQTHPTVKAATYHGVEVSYVASEWRIYVVLDI